MSKKNTAEEIPVDSIEELSAKQESIVDEVVVLSEKVEKLEGENAALQAELEALRAATAAVANSVSIAPPPAKVPERPVVEIEGERYQFKTGLVRIGGRRIVPAVQIAADETLLAEVWGKYPGLFAKL